MYLEHYGLAEPPFRITPHTDFFFSGANRGATLEALLYAITNDEGIVKISGEVGSGKTMLCRVLMERLPGNVVIVYLANPSLSREDILYALADELGIEVPESSRTATVMRALQEKLVALYAEGKQVVALIDEAHAMPMETLEEIRLLSNLESNRHKLLQLVLFGQPELNETLARADMRQLRERITHNFSLEPLVHDDIAQYLDFRMRAAGYRGPSVFVPAALKQIARASQGLTRRINILADKALLASFAAGSHQVGAKEAQAAIKDAAFSSTPATGGQPTHGGLIWAVGGALAMLILTGVWQLVANPASAPQENSSAAIAPISQPTPPVLTPSPAAEVAPKPEATTTTPLLDKLLTESRPWLDSVDDNRWFLQLYTAIDADRPEQVEMFLVQTRNSGVEMALLRVYHFSFGKADRYGVIYGDFVSRKNAVKALETLPAELKRYRPYPRQAIRLRLDSNTRIDK
ncbi:MAG: AAA family ATPase [Rhodocyclaceae bacterium]|nr:AAA family ATPase [Rhodocyclaceae bacterium]